MSFKEWLLSQLINDGVVDEFTEEEDLTKEFLMTTTDLDEDDYANLEAQFIEHCTDRNVDPIWDVEEE